MRPRAAEEDLGPFVSFVMIATGWLTGITIAIWDIWGIWVAFAGGYLPVPWEWYTAGGFWSGILWLVFAAIASGILFNAIGWVISLLMMPFVYARERRQNGRQL